jgi:hypothetical protein
MRLGVLVLASLSVVLGGAGPQSQHTPVPHVQGWIEAVAIVRDLDRVGRLFVETAGYERRHSGVVAGAVLRLWDLPSSAKGREVLLAEPGTSRGLVRLVELLGVEEQVEARSAGQFFDTGGIMGLNVRVRDIDRAFERMQEAGWRPLADPVRFSVEEFSVAEAIFNGPDGLVLGLIERERPPLGPDWTMGPDALSRPNNAFVPTRQLTETVGFYERELGWSVVLRDQGSAARAGMNLYGWPHNFVESVRRDVAWVHPVAVGEGSIAFMRLDGAEGRDFSQTAGPPNYGWIALRTWSDRPSSDLTTRSVGPFHLVPYGCVKVVVQTDPSGVRLEHLMGAEGCG